MAFIGRQHTIQQQIDNVQRVITFIDDPEHYLSRHYSRELEQWENKLALQENLDNKTEWDR